MDNEQLGDINAVAAVVGCSPRTAIRYADLGLMPQGLKIGGLRRWRMSEIQKWIDGGCKPVRRAKV